jgi:hypothetical protein
MPIECTGRKLCNSRKGKISNAYFMNTNILSKCPGSKKERNVFTFSHAFLKWRLRLNQRSQSCNIRVRVNVIRHFVINHVIRKWWNPNNASKWQMGFNSAFKGLIIKLHLFVLFYLLCIGSARSWRTDTNEWFN